MTGNRTGNRRIGSILLALGCLVVTGATAWSFFGNRVDSLASVAPGEITASIESGEKTLGSSGLPVPRFVSLKAEKVNVRRGPSSDHPVAWVFNRKGMPVEVVAEFENWRRIRDSDGEEGWILQSMLTGKRTAVVAPWRQGQAMPLYDRASPQGGMVAKVAAGVVSDVETCTGEWCEITTNGYDGWIEQSMLWGVYPGEAVN